MNRTMLRALGAIESLPVADQPAAYRALAQRAGCAKDARELNQLADDIDSILQRRRQIAANLGGNRRHATP
jgi:hypothetical protein